MHPPARPILIAAGVLGFTGVALGAFGAHGLRDRLAEHGTTASWQTAVLYHLLHGVALLALAGVKDFAGPAASRAAACWTGGVVLFSGSLYGLSLGGPKFLGPVTPLGGVLLLAGWAIVAWTAWKRPTV